MDLNELLRAHQLEVMNANDAAIDGDGQSDTEDAAQAARIARYADAIGELRATMDGAGMESVSHPAGTVIYTSYTGPCLPPGE